MRRSSRLTVAGLRPSSVAIPRTLCPRRCKSAIVTRSSSDRYRDDVRPRRADHGWMVQPPTTAAGDGAPVSPTLPGPWIHPDDPARLRVRDPPRDQPPEPLPLRRLWSRTRPTMNHRDSRTTPVLRRLLETAPSLTLRLLRDLRVESQRESTRTTVPQDQGRIRWGRRSAGHRRSRHRFDDAKVALGSVVECPQCLLVGGALVGGYRLVQTVELDQRRPLQDS